MTGNTIRMGGNLSLGLWDDALTAGAMIFGFYAGGLATLALLDLGKGSAALTTVAPAVVLAGCLVLSDGAALAMPASVPIERLRLISVLTAFSLGGQVRKRCS